MANEYHKKIFLHVDLIQGLKSDEYATEYLSQEIKPFGLISTKVNVIQKVRKKEYSLFNVYLSLIQMR